jgi:hypothetical protein
MKRILSILVATAAFLTVTSAHAQFGGILNTGNGVANQALNMGSNKALEAAINDKIKKKNCAFKDKTTDMNTTCDVNAIISDLKNWKSGLGAVSKNVDIYINASAKDETLANKRAHNMEQKLRGGGVSWWDYMVTSNTANKDGLKIWVKVNN